MGEGRSIFTDARCFLSHELSGESLNLDQSRLEIDLEVMTGMENNEIPMS